MAATPTAALGADLDKLAADLEASYGHRRAHRGRLDQITAHITNLRSLIAQLPEEELREAEHETRLLAAHDSGYLIPGSDGTTLSSPALNTDQRERLREALARRNGGGK